jgi:hypothetical protein
LDEGVCTSNRAKGAEEFAYVIRVDQTSVAKKKRERKPEWENSGKVHTETVVRWRE